MEQAYEQGIHRREDVAQTFSKKAFRELTRDRCVPDTIHFDAGRFENQKEAKHAAGANYGRQ